MNHITTLKRVEKKGVDLNDWETTLTAYCKVNTKITTHKHYTLVGKFAPHRSAL